MLHLYRITFYLFITLIVAGVALSALKIDPKANIHPTAVLMGNVTVGAYTKIGPKVVIQGNVIIGHHVNILGQAVIHGNKITIGNYVRIDYGSRIVAGREVAPGITANTVADVISIGDNCWIGGNATVRGSRLENGSVVGMRAVADFNTHIESGALLAPGAVTLIDMVIPAHSMAEGIPAAITKKSISENDFQNILGVIPTTWIHYDNDQIAKEIDKNPQKVKRSYPGIDNRSLWKGSNIDPTAQIHPTAILTNATIGAYTKIGPNVVIARAVIGHHCEVRANSNIRSDVIIGNFCFLGERTHLGSARDGGYDNPLWMKDLTYISAGSVVHATKLDGGDYYGANATTDYGVWIHENVLIMSGTAILHDTNIRDDVYVSGSPELLSKDFGVPDSLWMKLAGFLPKRWLKEVQGPALEIRETYEEPLAQWDYTNKGVISPKAKIDPGAYVVGNVSIDEGARIYPGTYLEGTIHIGKETKIFIGSMIVSNDLDIGPHTHIYDQSMIVEGRTSANAGSPIVDKLKVGAFGWINHMMLLQGGSMEDFSFMNIGTGASFGTCIKREALLLNGGITYANQILPERSVAFGVPAKVWLNNTTMRIRMLFFYGRDFVNWDRMAGPEDLKKYILPE